MTKPDARFKELATHWDKLAEQAEKEGLLTAADAYRVCADQLRQEAATPAPAPQLPQFIRAEVERAIAKAIAPTGMSTHDGKAVIGHDKLRYMLALIDKLAATPAPAPSAPLRDAQEQPFEDWWERNGQFCRAGGGAYEKTFAWNAWCAALAATQAPAPLTDEQIEEILYSGTGANRLSQLEFARAIERAHGIGQGKETK